MTVKELIEHLQKMNIPDAQVVRIGHFGDLYEMTTFNFKPRMGYRLGGTYKLNNPLVLEVDPPDIGPEPD